MQAAENAMSWSAAMRTLPKYLLTLTQFTKSLDVCSRVIYRPSIIGS